MAQRVPRNVEGYIPVYIDGRRDRKGRYVEPSTGEIISKSTYYRSRRSETAEFNPYDVPRTPVGRIKLADQRADAQSRYWAFVDRAKSRNDILAKMGYSDSLTRQQIRQSADFKYQYQAYKNSKDRQKYGARYYSLVYFGIIEDGDDYY